ncbi:MAG: metallophosphoesterase family protein, partial [Candidatus Hodarchaeales archaeon]
MAKIAIISDSHVTEGRRFSNTALKAGLEIINEIKPSLVTHLGDVTENGTLAEYELASELLKPLINGDHKTYFIPGNHDVKNLGHELFSEFFGARSFNIIFDDILLIGIDSTLPDRNDGRLGRANIRELEQRLKSTPDHFFKIVAVHHHALPVRGGGRERSTLSDAGDLLQVLFDTKCNLVISGHRHTAEINTLIEHRHKLQVLNVGTVSCTKTRGKEGNSLVVLDIQPDEKKVKIRNVSIFPERREVVTDSFLSNPPVKKPVLKRPKARLIHIANTHFSSTGSKFMKRKFFQGVREIKTMDPVPEAIVHCGGITESGREKDYLLASEGLKMFDPVPLVVSPGSNDWQGLGIELFDRYFDTKNVLETDHFVFLSNNSCLPGEKVGNLGRRTMSKILDAINLARESGKLPIIAFNHLVIAGPQCVYSHMLEDAGEALSALSKQNSPVIVLTGQ